MKIFRVILRDGREFCITAEIYRREDQQYVFDDPSHSEVQFFRVDEVAGIVVEPPDYSRPVKIKDEI